MGVDINKEGFILSYRTPGKIYSYLLYTPIVGCSLFIILTSIAMLFYPGGTKVDSSTRGYNLFMNFFSDLGRTVSHSGSDNTISFVLFVIALTLSGFSFLVFFNFLPNFLPQTSLSEFYGNKIRISGIIAGLAIIAIAFTPANLIQLFHDLMVLIAFTSILLTSIGLMWIIFNSKEFHLIYTIIFLILMVLILIYGVIGLLFFQVNNNEGLFLRVTAQKLVVYFLNICYIIQSIGFIKYQKIRRFLFESKS